MRAGALIVILGLILGWAAPRAAGAVPAPDDSLLNLDWRVFIAAKPIYCILVEKDRQRLLVLRHDGRIQVEAEYRVGTGAHTGPKREEGDSRTPEGVYFITKGYLDHKLSVFGTRAYHLNYPNYFDLRRGRTGFGIFLGSILGGQVLIEQVFSYPGLGFQLVRAVSSRDYPLMGGLFLSITTGILVVNFLVDIVYTYIDPRVRRG